MTEPTDADRQRLRAWLDRPCPPRLEDTELWNRPPEEWLL